MQPQKTPLPQLRTQVGLRSSKPLCPKSPLRPTYPSYNGSCTPIRCKLLSPSLQSHGPLLCNLHQPLQQLLLQVQVATLMATEAILNLHVTYDKMLHQSPQSALLSVDFKKGFDFVFHKYFLVFLQHIGFPPNFIHGTARLYISGRLSFSFKVSQGVCQKDPLSGPLFIIAMKPLLQAIPLITGLTFA